MSFEYKVKDVKLAPKGRMLIHWAESHMPVLMRIKEFFKREKPIKEVKVGACLHVTKETAILIETLLAGGAKVALCASNPLSTQDEVAASLAEEGVNVYAWRGEAMEDYYDCISSVLNHKPQIVLDDGADLIFTLHKERPELTANCFGGNEETTTGVLRIKAMERQDALRIPIIAVNNAQTKWDFDNVYGTGQSTIDGVLRATNILIAGKRFVIAGYGHCGRGLAMRAKGMGAHVIITEVDPIKALRASLEGYEVMPMSEAAKIGDIFVTVTGNKDVVREEHMMLMKDGAILANSGHFNVEISLQDLEENSISKKLVKDNVEEYTLKNGRRLYLLAEGRLVNLAAAEGHPSEVMDMSFSLQALCAKYLTEKGKTMKPKVYEVPSEVDRKVAELKLETMGVKIDKLTPGQEEYLKSYELGTI